MYRTRKAITALAALVITVIGAALVTAPLALATSQPLTQLLHRGLSNSARSIR